MKMIKCIAFFIGKLHIRSSNLNAFAQLFQVLTIQYLIYLEGKHFQRYKNMRINDVADGDNAPLR